MNHELKLFEQTKRTLEKELNTQAQQYNELKLQLQITERERDKCNLKAQALLRQIDGYIGQLKLKNVEIVDYKKRLTEAEAKCRQLQNMLKVANVERSSYTKSIVLAQDKNRDLEKTNILIDHQVEQLKEECANNEIKTTKLEFLLSKVEKENEAIKSELQSAKDEIVAQRQQYGDLLKEKKQLHQTIRQIKDDINKKQKDNYDIMNERDILGTQLVRRNDELSLQDDRIKILTGTVQCGEKEYGKRLNDIKLLKSEVKALRREKALLVKSLLNNADLRQEILHLNRDLTDERLRVMALEEEVQTPLNIHRWRILQESHLSKFDPSQKIRLLEKRILQQSRKLIEQDKQIRVAEKLSKTLCNALSKNPGPEVKASLRNTQKALRSQGEKLKCLMSEVNMYETIIRDYKFELNQVNTVISAQKKVYYYQRNMLN
ncbi:cilia- and flagella-associated protein 58-like [Prorops nasuta]|uniref:cilia- and flagella-associated protein 58-like n=1 Tax=Prorops nasuta TaxID=863751 RepID=UPI0034CD8CE4